MEEKNQVQKTISEALVKVAEKGEDLKVKVVDITKETVKNALERTGHSKENVTTVARNAIRGVLQGTKELKINSELINNAIIGIIEGTKASGIKVVELTKIAADAAIEVVNKAGSKIVITKDAVKKLLKGEKKE